MGLYVDVTIVNKTENYTFGSDGEYETFCTTIGELYREMMGEYGRCEGKMYVDSVDGVSKQIGWVFLKRAKYTDCNETYLQETWVAVMERPTEIKTERTYHYADFSK